MKDFEFFLPTRIVFGKRALKTFKEELSQLGKRILFLYGRSSIKKIGLYEEILSNFQRAQISFIELSGIKPNPSLSCVLSAIEIAQRFKPDCILAVGGGSVIDAGKAIACGYYHPEELWNFYERKGNPQKALPLAVILTIAGAGSEANDVSVLVNSEKQLKLSLRSPLLYPKVSYLDPTLTFTVPKDYTAYGIMDTFSHLFEFFHFRLHPEENLTENFLILLMKRLIREGKKALEDPENYSARSQLMWIGTLALSPLIRCGIGKYRFFLHSLEHPISGILDLPHGLGLAILMRAYLKKMANFQLTRRFFSLLFNIPENKNLSQKGLEKFDELLETFGIPKTLKELKIDSSYLNLFIEKACEILYIWKAEKEFSPEIVRELYEIAYFG